jgi:predicted nucleotidyltransferase
MRGRELRSTFSVPSVLPRDSQGLSPWIDGFGECDLLPRGAANLTFRTRTAHLPRAHRDPIHHLLAPREHAAALEFVARVRRRVPAELLRALLFGSRARGDARPDSDLDVLLVFHRLAPDREPHATWAEEIAGEVAEETGVPVQTWCVSLPDLRRGCRTPMLVDALDDGLALWPAAAPPPRIRYTPADALFCAGALLHRVEEGSDEFAEALETGDVEAAARRARDDVVRLCTAALLLRGETRPRRGGAVRRFAAGEGIPRDPVLAWTVRSFGPDGKNGGPVAPPPGGLGATARTVDALRALVERRAAALARGGPPP